MVKLLDFWYRWARQRQQLRLVRWEPASESGLERKLMNCTLSSQNPPTQEDPGPLVPPLSLWSNRRSSA
jgi:hypothetical protein